MPAIFHKPDLRTLRDHAILVAGAVVMGAGVACFAAATDKAQAVFAFLFQHMRFFPLLLTPAAFALASFLVNRYAPGAAGSGVQQTLAAQHLAHKSSHAHLLGPRVLAGKILLVILVLMCGASLGREGPCVQVGAAIMLLFANATNTHDRRMFIMAGGAAGFAAAFNAPLAGIAFLVEEMARGVHYKERLTILTTILFAGVAAICVTGDYDYFGHIQPRLNLSRDWIEIIVAGVVCGAAGGVFNILITHGRARACALGNGFGRRHPAAFAAGCGLLVAVLGIATGGVSFGSGYEIGHALLHGETAPALWHPFAKMAATVISIFSGVPGGTIAPSLSIGATIGGAITPLFPHTPVEIIVLLAMAGYFAAFTQAPITAAVIVLEITGRAPSVLPLLAVALLAATVSRLVFPHSIFDLLAGRIADDLKEKDEALSRSGA